MFLLVHYNAMHCVAQTMMLPSRVSWTITSCELPSLHPGLPLVSPRKLFQQDNPSMCPLYLPTPILVSVHCEIKIINKWLVVVCKAYLIFLFIIILILLLLLLLLVSKTLSGVAHQGCKNVDYFACATYMSIHLEK